MGTGILRGIWPDKSNVSNLVFTSSHFNINLIDWSLDYWIHERHLSLFPNSIILWPEISLSLSFIEHLNNSSEWKCSKEGNSKRFQHVKKFSAVKCLKSLKSYKNNKKVVAIIKLKLIIALFMKYTLSLNYTKSN